MTVNIVILLSNIFALYFAGAVRRKNENVTETEFHQLLRKWLRRACDRKSYFFKMYYMKRFWIQSDVFTSSISERSHHNEELTKMQLYCTGGCCEE